jgi:hypothetical protein
MSFTHFPYLAPTPCGRWLFFWGWWTLPLFLLCLLRLRNKSALARDKSYFIQINSEKDQWLASVIKISLLKHHGLTSTSHKALELVADVAVVLPVVLRNTNDFFLYSSIVKNFSCSAWKSRTTSP